jgi:hypothetical protein
LAQTELLRLSSSVTSLDSIVTLFRYQSLINGGMSSIEKHSTSVNIVSASNVYINSQLFREVDTDSTEEHFTNFKDVFPHVCSSENFEDFDTNYFVLGNKLSAAPADFDKYLTSGKKSSAMNSDISVKLNLYTVPSSAIVATTFMISTVLMQLEAGGRGDIRVTY